MTGDGENGHSVASRTWCVDRHGIGQCLGAVEVEARENPSGLAAANSPAASRSRIYVSSCDCCTESSQPVAIGRGPYTSTHGTKRTSESTQPMSAFGGKADIGRTSRCLLLTKADIGDRRGVL